MGKALADTSRYDILFDLPKGEYNAPQVGGIRTRTIKAGDTIEVECYPLTRVGPAARQEARARRRQSAKQAMLNRLLAAKRIRRLIEHNFTRQDWVLTLTWDYGPIDRNHMSYAQALEKWDALKLPVDEEDARRELNNYLRRLKNRIRRKGGNPAELKDLYVLESTHENREGPRPLYAHYHFHIVLHAPGLSRDELQELWPWGDIRGDRLSFRDEGPARLAQYLTKSHKVETVDADGVRRRRWGRSKNLIEPPQTVSDRRISRRRAAKIAADVQYDGRAIFERVYPGYRCVEDPEVKYSDFVSGAYIYARLRKITEEPPWGRKGPGKPKKRNEREEAQTHAQASETAE